MNKTLLINRIDPSDDSKQKRKIFFIIGDMNVSTVENKLIDILNNSKLINSEDMLLKYNGIELDISIEQIPSFVELLTNKDISIYGIYERYNPSK